MKTLSFYTGIILSLLISCTPDDEVISSDPSFQLQFSVDTVFFDTLFTSKEDEGIDMRSVTQRFMVYNNSENAVNISEISLNDPNSVYSMLINGQNEDIINNTLLRGGDSMLVLTEANVPYQNADDIRELNGQISFFTNGNRQAIQLNAYAEDPFYVSGGAILVGDVVWEKGRPYVITDSLYISQNASLTANAGTRIVFDNGAKLLISGSLQLMGTPQDTIRLESIRLDGQYENAPGQWDGLFFDSLSHDNKIHGTLIKNARVGVLMYHNDNDDIIDLDIEGSTIQNMSQVGVAITNSDVRIVNTIISHTISYAYAHAGGGKCDFYYNTIVNSNTGFFREDPSVAFESTNEVIQLNLVNNIIWGNLSNELVVTEGVDFNSITNNILKASSDQFDPETNLINIDPYFRYPFTYNFDLADDSPARGAGIDVNGITVDQRGENRTSPPDIGALQWIPEEE
ncbi:hypothetical protein KMW28_18385 [Flammeovirga yaeyamensis]|uniref:Right handed beta helix domain-containing protein n=1 Tax=Flammeovirga yaeyamensis TaxID=367791 RepID=A0AAX1N265_9BACT|nr:choice-of-anchor Q domain-containing protein [Flammeovirga yaeyamensis]MBB3701131.1 hypothetical protein [Flammeovirga yaeyamensis]NMF38401.1 hypothetical protein [Flammeovirga yaeyamensis]QWG01599.1 hypothetical protein KMW28_18385 [Flammeovirga yaeyamensis]